MILSAKNLTKTFPSPKPLTVLSNISLNAHQGDTIAICGRSGEGKTTLLHILGALESPDSGQLFIANELVNPKKKRRSAQSSHRICLSILQSSRRFYSSR
jgi:ABC-type antimicrobial peptide transport system, ATPase component